MNVILYKTQSCPWCHKTEEFLKKNSIRHSSVDVGRDHKAAQEMIKKSGQYGVPVIDIDGKIIVGYDEYALKKALKIAG